jgi:uncharacterized protein YoxC
LSEKRELYEKARKEMRLSERILAELPGFRGYKEKEIRRETDRLLRNHLYQKLSRAKNNLKDVFQQLSENRQFGILNEMDRLVMKFDRIAEKINHASYGYAGFFNVLKIDEEKLDKMYDVDDKLLEETSKILEVTSTFKGDVLKKKFEKVNDHVQKINLLIESLEEKFDERGDIVIGVR